MDGWMDGKYMMDGWMDGWMDGKYMMDGWQIYDDKTIRDRIMHYSRWISG